MSAQDALLGRVQRAVAVLQRIRDHGPWVDDSDWGGLCMWCPAERGTSHAQWCLWLEVVAATTPPPSDDVGLPGDAR